MSVVVDINNICLVCLSEADGNLRSVFEESSEPAETPMSIAEKIAQCSVLRLVENKMPIKICQLCVDDLDTAWRFKQNCENADSVLKTIQRQHKEAEEMAEFELQMQRKKLKLPSGLKITRIKSQSKKYLLPVQQLQEEEDQEDLEGEVEQQDSIDEAEENSVTLDVAVLEDEVKVEEDRGSVNCIDDDEISIEEYYEELESLQELNDSEVDDSDVGNAPNNSTLKLNKETLVVEEEECFDNEINVKYDDENYYVHNKPKKIDMPPLRGRGRPKKYVQVDNNPKNNVVPTTSNAVKNSSSALKTYTQQGLHRSTESRETLPNKLRKLGSHNKARPLKICEICGNTYKYQHALNAHMRRHYNDRPFGCEFCDKAFVSNVELRRHMRVHTGQKPYGCKFCERRFSDFGSRIKHERTHTGERPYVCTTCDKSFAYAHVLSVHLRTHTGEKKFQCNQCSKGFTKKSYLLSHMEQHDRDNSAEEAFKKSNNLVEITSIKIENDVIDEEAPEYEVEEEKDENSQVSSTISDSEEITFIGNNNEDYELEEYEGDMDTEYLEDKYELQKYILSIRPNKTN